MAAAGVSPSSSPRLPSPPPFTEVQIGPKSPTIGDSYGKDAGQLFTATHGRDDASNRRIRPGTKASEMAFGPPLVPLAQLDSPFQLQEHLKALYHHYTKPEGSGTVVPISHEVAAQLTEPPEGVDRSLWLYELCRFLTMKVNNLIIAFFAEDPPCSAQTCPEMRASEWQYLCAVHDPPKSCCAIDYCCHTLDWAMNILTSPKYFPSRLTLGSEAGGGPQASMRHLTNVFRRLYRIFAHAWFQHRDVFWQVEGQDGLYAFFKTVCDTYSLIPEENYTIPQEAEGVLEAVQQQVVQGPGDGRRLTIFRKQDENHERAASEDSEFPSVSTGATTRRHKHSPSTGTIPESAERDETRADLPDVKEDSAADQLQSETAKEAAVEQLDHNGPFQQNQDDNTSIVTIEVRVDEEAPIHEANTESVKPDTVESNEGEKLQASEEVAAECKVENTEFEEGMESVATEVAVDGPSAEDSVESSRPEWKPETSEAQGA